MWRDDLHCRVGDAATRMPPIRTGEALQAYVTPIPGPKSAARADQYPSANLASSDIIIAERRDTAVASMSRFVRVCRGNEPVSASDGVAVRERMAAVWAAVRARPAGGPQPSLLFLPNPGGERLQLVGIHWGLAPARSPFSLRSPSPWDPHRGASAVLGCAPEIRASL
jgi:hypothetical protein